MKTIIVTAADEKFSLLFIGLIQSLHQWDAPLCDAIGVLNLGLSDATMKKVQGRVTHVVTPVWDLPCDLTLQKNKPFLRAKTARPFLPKYFPGYDIYIWLDADTWVQEKYAVEYFIEAAKEGGMGLVSELGRCYLHSDFAVNWRTERLYSYYGDEALALHAKNSYYNSGAFSLLADAPHWNLWARHLKAGLEVSPKLVTDQTALNYSIWKDKLPLHPLPDTCNWFCHLVTPNINTDTMKLCEPLIPHRPIGLVHLASASKDVDLKFRFENKIFDVNLRFQGLSSLANYKLGV